MAIRLSGLLILVGAVLTVYANEQMYRENPIRKVVTMLQKMQAKVEEEAKAEQALFEKFMCYCKSAGGDLGADMKEGENKIESLTAALKSAKERKAQTEADLTEHQTGRAEAKAAMDEATGIREKEAAAFAKFQEDSETNLAALGKAIPAVEQGMKGSFLQTTSAVALRRYTMEKAVLPDETRQELLAFLSGGGSEEYDPQSGQIVGILVLLVVNCVAQKSKQAKLDASMACGRSRKKNWNKGKVREKLDNMVMFDKATYDKMMKEISKAKLITPSVVSERLKVNGSVARSAIRHLEEKGLATGVGEKHHTQMIYTRKICGDDC